MKSIPPQDIQQTDNNRFELRDAPGPGGNVIDKFATREAADRALAENQEKNPGIEYIIADMGARAAPTAADQHAENGKTAEQKQQEEDQKKANAPDPNRRSVETPRSQDAHQ